MTSLLRAIAVFGAALGCWGSVHAAYLSTTNGSMTTYYGDRNNGSSAAPSGDALKAKTDFLSMIKVIGTESFSNLSDPQPFTSNFLTGGLGATIGCLDSSGNNPNSPDPVATCNVASAPLLGRFDTTTGSGSYLTNNTFMYSGSDSETNGAIVVTFEEAVQAFGFYGTDIGDFSATFSIVLTDLNGVQTTLKIDEDGGLVDNSLLFFGFVDSKNSYKSITFTNLFASTAANDGLGIDDLVSGSFADTPNPTPEPLSALLVMAGLAAAGAARRARR